MTNTKTQAIQEIVRLCQDDRRIFGVIHYGSDAKGVADQWSDLDLLILVDSAEHESFVAEQENWLRQISNILHVYTANGCPRLFLDDELAPLRIDTAFWPNSRINEISQFNWKPKSMEAMLVYENHGRDEIKTEISKLINRDRPSPFNVIDAFTQLEGDFWYYLLRIYGLIKRGNITLALTEYHWCVLDYLGWFILLESGQTKNWREGLSANYLFMSIDIAKQELLQTCLPYERSLQEACTNAISVGRATINRCAEMHNLPASYKLADRIEGLFYQESMSNKLLQRDASRHP